MTLFTFFITLVIIGVIYWLVVTYIPLPEVIRTVFTIVLVVVVICLLLALLKIMPLPFSLK